jgi:tryptophanyl-tRNA synthetase
VAVVGRLPNRCTQSRAVLWAAAAVNRLLDPMRERRARFEASGGLVEDLIVTGTRRARREVQRTVTDMRRAMGLTAVFSQLREDARQISGADGI